MSRIDIIGHNGNEGEHYQDKIKRMISEAEPKYSSLLDEYQQFTKTTAIYPKDRALDYLISGLSAEAGEVAGKYAKYLRDNKPPVSNASFLTFRNSIKLELGDCLWMISQLCNEFNISLDSVIWDNIHKLKDRQSRNTISGSGDNR